MAKGRGADVAAKLMWAGVAAIVLLIVGGFVLSALGALFKLLMYLVIVLLVVGGGVLLVRSFTKSP